MLSVANPPPDPSCSLQSQPLNSNGDGLNHHPNFSIRDYIFTARRKDIKKNWPFSSKSLQLCLKSGVKELLPPFDRCVVETSYLQKEKTGNRSVWDLNSNDPRLYYKLVESCFDTSSCRSLDDNDFPSSTTTASHSEIESLKLSTSLTEPSSKKCRLTVKFGGSSGRSSTEDIASMNFTVSGTMASNVCPVCKTFSSSSNTTLNAHIDQCLSVESTPRWTSDSKLIRDRIKPRKTRSMVDIYSTALPCTMEELDRRNGTTWAVVSCFPIQEIEKTGNSETVNEGKRRKVSQSHSENIGDVGPVYVDSNGKKLGILSQSDGLPSVSKVMGDIEARRPRKGDKGGKFILKKKRKRLAQKHREFQQLAPQSKMNFSPNVHSSQIVEVECEGEAKSCDEENMVSNKSKQSDSISLKPWVCSKRRGFTKKTSQEGRQPVKSNWQLPRDLPAFNSQEEREEIADESVKMNALHVPEQVEELAIRTSQPDHSFQSTEDYERLLLGTESDAPPAPNELHFDCELDTLSNGKSFPEVDPIPIPGPPGSFLPSPRDMGSEDLQGNISSLTTSQVHHDVVDGDALGSPRSASSVGPSADSDCGDKGSLGFENERLSQAVALNLQDSQLLMAFSNPITSGNISFGDPAGSSSASNLVLRLMGKNLLVVNKDDDPL